MTDADHRTNPELHAPLGQRYGKAAQLPHILWNPQVAGLLRHRSVRAFRDAALPAGALATLVAAAQSPSTSSNLHQWSVVAVSAPDLKARLAALAGGNSGSANRFIEQAPVLLLWVADASRNHAIARAAGAETTIHDYLDTFLMVSIDTALAAQNAAVAAESLGLGIVYVGAMRNAAHEVAELVGLPQHSYVTFGMAVGLPAEDFDEPAQLRPRPPQQVVLHHNRYDGERAQQALADYEAAHQHYRVAGGKSARPWRDDVLHASTMAYLDEREDLRTTVQARGFGLR